MAKVYIGTSGFSYSHWGKGIFYPQDLPQRDWFLYYTKQFDTVELNVSFYRLPKKETFEKWRAIADATTRLPHYLDKDEKGAGGRKKAGSRFVFAVKGSRFITHVKRLKDCQEPVKTFFQNAKGIKNSNDVILWQLPPKFKANIERLGQFLKILPKNWWHAFEFRNDSWLTEEIYKLFKKYKVAIVFQDYPGWPVAEEITADFVYLRFHGKTDLYTSCYTEKELIKWARKIKAWQKKGLDCYAYFNNDALGYAIENARDLKERCKK